MHSRGREIPLMVEDKEEIRKIILDNVKTGDTFYNVDIIAEHNLDLEIGAQVIDKLVEEGLIKEGSANER